MKLHNFSYRFAEEIIQHPAHHQAWDEIKTILSNAPLFVYPKKSKKNSKLDVVQQLMNTYFDRVMVIENKWIYHPLATNIVQSGLKADFKKTFGDIVIQAEFQFGNMSRWYSDIFKFQTAYSQSLIDIGLSIIPVASLAKRIDSNVVQYERCIREIPSAKLSITLPILMIGLEADRESTLIDVSQCNFESITQITGKGFAENRWRIVNGYLEGKEMKSIGPSSPTGPMLDQAQEVDEDEI